MSSAVRPSPDRSEADFLSGLGSQYMARGFTFKVDPSSAELPPFFGPYRPDAIAQKPGTNFAIEIRKRSDQVTTRSISEIRKLFEGQPDWRLVVEYMGSDLLDKLVIASSTTDTITARLADVRALAEQGQLRAAFVLGWSLLEAALQSVHQESSARPRKPATVVQALASLGYLDPALERRVRPLIILRNRIVHGDLTVEPSSDDVDAVLSAVDEALSEHA